MRIAILFFALCLLTACHKDYKGVPISAANYKLFIKGDSLGIANYTGNQVATVIEISISGITQYHSYQTPYAYYFPLNTIAWPVVSSTVTIYPADTLWIRATQFVAGINSGFYRYPLQTLLQTDSAYIIQAVLSDSASYVNAPKNNNESTAPAAFLTLTGP